MSSSLWKRFALFHADGSDQVVRWVTRLRDLGNGRSLDWSDEWTEEDIADVQRSSLAAFDERESRNSWGRASAIILKGGHEGEP